MLTKIEAKEVSDIVLDALDRGINDLVRVLGYVNLNSRGRQWQLDTLQNFLFMEGFVCIRRSFIYKGKIHK